MFFSPGICTEIWFFPWLATVAPLAPPASTRLLRMVTMVSSCAWLTGVWVW